MFLGSIVFNKLNGGQEVRTGQTAWSLRQHNYYTRTATPRVDKHPLNKLTGLHPKHLFTVSLLGLKKYN